jgi:ABC-2 type transport system permease protein
VLAIGNEYSTGMIKLSLTAMPRRLTWLLAKGTVLTAPVLTAAALAVAGAALAGWLILPGYGFTPAHGYPSLTSATDIRAAGGPRRQHGIPPKSPRTGARRRNSSSTHCSLWPAGTQA